MEKRHDYVLWFEECNLDSIPIVGGKNASLGELLSAEIPVPPGFAVTTKAYNRFLEQGGIKKEIFKILKDIKPNDMDSGETASKKIRSLIENTPVDEELQDYMGEFYRRLSKKCHVPAVPVAVRSSATAEDLPGASFAGQQDTFLWIRGIDDVFTHIKNAGPVFLLQEPSITEPKWDSPMKKLKFRWEFRKWQMPGLQESCSL